jgi:hypothetical protein
MDPATRLKGAACKTVIATVQVTAVPTFVQAGYVVHPVPALFLIYTVYPVIAVVPVAGATQLIATLVPKITVVGASGALGAVIRAPLPAAE